MRWLRNSLVLVVSVAVLSACANLNTINRSTSLPKSGGASGKAIHLDIQQRLVLVNEFGSFCSEPSPDALAAYAAALGVGGSSLGAGAESAAGGAQSSAASVGLRTQSITLMRDALYRMCEAYANGAVGTAQVAALLSRSQDLTAVILAVEQLTGAVAANQAALVSSTTADSSASLLASSELLDAAIKNEERAQKALEQAVEQLAATKTNRDAADRALKEAQTKRDGLSETASTEQKGEAEVEVQFRQAERDRTQRAVEAAQARAEIRQKAFDNAQRTRETIAAKQDQAFAATSASTDGSAQLSTPIQRVQLDKAATEAIAGSVESMVTEVLRKEYIVESCMAIVTAFPRDYSKWTPERKTQFEHTRVFCMDLVKATVLERTKAITTSFAADATSDRIDAWLQGPGNREKLKAWLDKQVPKVPVFALLQGSYRELRQRAINHFKIPNNSGETQ